jgi:glycerol uptake facilitator-like aquaporin
MKKGIKNIYYYYMLYSVIFGEFIGTFILIFMILCTMKFINNVYIRLIFQGLAFYIAISVAIYFSDAHINPIRTLVQYIYHYITLEEFITYIIAQILGGIAAIIIFEKIIKNRVFF